MSDRMKTVDLCRLSDWIRGEAKRHDSVFGIPVSRFHRPNNRGILGDLRYRIFGSPVEAPFGPAAGPHTQLAQNIVCSYLTGCRFIELKTVQVLDDLEFPKPCIDVLDEGYNTEWSQELSLEESLEEYLKAWLLIHALSREFDLSPRDSGPGFLFNMSVGYDLQGLKSEKMDRFMEGMRRPRSRIDALLETLESSFPGLDLPSLNGGIVHSVTISTMHGCPPDEIERIAVYLMGEKELDTYVKLNPTLLGEREVRSILLNGGWEQVDIADTTFEKDLQYDDAVLLIRNLKAFAEKRGRHVGIKLSNTLPNRNTAGVLPGDERYMSGRALYPLTINLASRLAEEFDGDLHLSFSGGASLVNVADILRTGISPVTLCTDALKPGGYLRFAQIAASLDRVKPPTPPAQRCIDLPGLRALAESSLRDHHYRRAARGPGRVKLSSHLSLFDCVTAPCVHACPIHQDIPAYIEAVERGAETEALRIVLRNNPLPNITGYICDHQCMDRCVRLHYDDPVYIRALKRFAAVWGEDQLLRSELAREAACKRRNVKVAVVGSGPAGLAASFFLAREGFSVTIFERRDVPGGTVRYTIPRFRLPDEVIDRDVSLIEALGVEIRTGCHSGFSLEDLRSEGYGYVILATGSGRARKLELPGVQGAKGYYSGVEFLEMVKKGEKPTVGSKVLVIGGGNSAVDAARTALRFAPETLRIVYRRDRESMPADREEIDACEEEGIAFDELLSPRELLTERGRIVGLRCVRNTLGALDETGRRSPVPLEDQTVDLEADTVIAAVGEAVEIEPLLRSGIRLVGNARVAVAEETGETSVRGLYAAGDCVRGPATVVEAIADGKRVARAILHREDGVSQSLEDRFYETARRDRLEGNRARRGSVRFHHPVPRLNLDERRGFDTVIQTVSARDAVTESERCLHCSQLCGTCVEVCPNRANVLLFIEPVHISIPDLHVQCSLAQTTQILHIDDLCNECGNCETFCPHRGRPYEDKPTLFSGKEMFEQSRNSGFYPVSDTGQGTIGFRLRAHGGLFDLEVDRERGMIRLDADGLTLSLHGKSEAEVTERASGSRGPAGVTADVVGLALLAAHCAEHHPYLLH
jgi:putative selenate reductase